MGPQLDYCAVLLWSALVGAFLIIFYIFLIWPYDAFKKQGLKGPKPLPLVGTLLTSFKKSFAELDMENVQRYGKVYGTFTGRRPVVIISNPDMVKEILVKEFSCFVNRTIFRSLQQKPLDRMMTVISDDHWRHVRSSLSPAYSSGKLKQMLPTINGCVKHLVNYIEKHVTEPIATKEVLAGYTMDVIAGTAFALDTRSLEQPDHSFLTNAKEVFRSVDIRNPKTAIVLMASLISPSFGFLLTKLGLKLTGRGPLDYIEGIVRNILYDLSSGCEDQQDFLHLCRENLVDMKSLSSDSVMKTDNGVFWTTKGLTEDDIISNAFVFLLGGYDTVSTFLNFFCYAMATNPDIQQKAYEEIEKHLQQEEVTYDKLQGLAYLEMCMEETLRMYPPILRLDRKCNKTTTISGVTISSDMSVNIAVYAMHHDADYWEDPFTFVPERFTPEAKAERHPFVYLPFGAGPRNCIAMRLALLESKAAIVSLLSKYEICTCSKTVKPPMKFGPSIGFTLPREPILLTFNKRPVI